MLDRLTRPQDHLLSIQINWLVTQPPFLPAGLTGQDDAVVRPSYNVNTELSKKETLTAFGHEVGVFSHRVSLNLLAIGSMDPQAN